jgi:hypothetical protein
MSIEIPDLWSEGIRVDVLSPLAILRGQENLLRKRTKGILEAIITTTNGVTQLEHHFDLLAPLLQYRERLLTARHKIKLVYPVEVIADVFVPKENQSFPALPISPIYKALGSFKLPANVRVAATQEEFVKLIREVLHSPDVNALAQSLIAKSNELKLEGDQTGTESSSPSQEPSGGQ